MSELLNHVSPLTRGIIWLCEGDLNPESRFYREVDYLMDGLLTAHLLKNEDHSSMLIVGTSFGQTFYVFIIREFKAPEFKSFLELLKKDLADNNDLLLIDPNNKFEAVKTHLKPISSHLRTINS